MTELEHVEIEGFKGLEYVEFEPSDINLITGRNNTGKTSLLEAIELSRDPEKIRRFGDNVRATVNRDFSEAIVETKVDSGVDELVVRPASAEESEQYFEEALTEHFRSSIMTGRITGRASDGTSIASLSVSSASEVEIDERFQEIISKAVARAIAEVPDSLTGTHLVIKANNEKYPYMYFDKSGWRLPIEISAVLEDILIDEFGAELVEEHPDAYVVDDPEYDSKVIEFQTGFSRILDGDLFLREPPELGDITSIITGKLTENAEGADSEDDAIRVDDIGDFIKQKGIVNDLKTFSLDTLIFEDEDGEKHQIPYEFMGDGFKSMVGLLWELMDDDVANEIILIEEPETHMHPGYVAELVHFLIDLARDEDIQFFITTHDHDFIADFFMDMPEEKREYLEDEFSLVKMDDFGADVMEYEDAEHHLKDLHLDLRGI